MGGTLRQESVSRENLEEGMRVRADRGNRVRALWRLRAGYTG